MFGEMRPAGAEQKASDRRYGENPYRRVFGLSRNDAEWLLANAGHENDLNEVWQELGKRHGFIWTTVREVSGEDIGSSDPWLVTAEVETDLSSADLLADDDEPERLGWLLGNRWSTADLVILSIALAVAVTVGVLAGLTISVLWLVFCAITDPVTGYRIGGRADD